MQIHVGVDLFWCGQSETSIKREIYILQAVKLDKKVFYFDDEKKFKTTVPILFGGFQTRILKEHDKMLTTCYAPNYMTHGVY